MTYDERLRRTRFRWGLSLSILIVLWGYWHFSRPQLRQAAPADIRKMFTEDQSSLTPRNIQAVVRMMRLVSIAKRLKPTFKGLNTSSDGPISRRLPFAQSIWKRDKDYFNEVEEVLSDGPIEYERISESNLESASNQAVRYMARALGMIAVSLALDGDFASSTRAIDIELHLASRLKEAHGGYLEFLQWTTVSSIAENSVLQVSKFPAFPVAVCERWLSPLAPTTASDPLLKQAIETELRDYFVPKIAHPTQFMKDIIKRGIGNSDVETLFEPPPEDYSGFGTFDPQETSSIIQKIVLIQESNAMKPMTQYDHSFKKILAEQLSELPQVRGRRGTFDRMRFRFAMDNIRNSIGKAMIGFVGNSAARPAEMASFRYRANHECLRVFLAIRSFRAKHSGRLPDSISDLVPAILASLPVDPYNGQPLRFDRKKGLVWSVGENLRDDGGDVLGRSYVNRDIGISINTR